MPRPRNRAPKNITSVARKTHIPRAAVSCCWPRSRNCSSSVWRTRNESSTTARSSGVRTASSGLILGLLQVVLVGPADDNGGFGEILLGRRRRRLPLQAGGAPRVRPRRRPVPERVEQVAQRQQVADPQDGGAGRRHHVPDVELLRVL